MSAFTPGPWHYRPREADDWGIIRDADGRLIARATALPIPLRSQPGIIEADILAEHDELDRHRRNKTDPYEASARLIAAAPDLLDALRALHDECEAAQGPELRDDPVWGPLMRTAGAAIAKAEGRQP